MTSVHGPSGRVVRVVSLAFGLAALLLGVLVVDPAVAATPLRPDARVKLAGDSAWVGNDVYNSTAAGQVREATVLAGATATFKVSLQNDGRADPWRVRGTGSGAGFTVRYRYNGTVVTSAVVAGTFSLSAVPSGATRTLVVDVTAAGSVAPGTVKTVKVTLTSRTNATKVDVVKAKTRVRAPNQAPQFPNPLNVSVEEFIDYDEFGHLIGVTDQITVDACVDPDGDPLTYRWSATNGSLDPSTTTTATWHRLIIGGRVQAGTVTVECEDPDGASDSHLIRFP